MRSRPDNPLATPSMLFASQRPMSRAAASRSGPTWYPATGAEEACEDRVALLTSLAGEAEAPGVLLSKAESLSWTDRRSDRRSPVSSWSRSTSAMRVSNFVSISLVVTLIQAYTTHLASPPNPSIWSSPTNAKRHVAGWAGPTKGPKIALPECPQPRWADPVKPKKLKVKLAEGSHKEGTQLRQAQE